MLALKASSSVWAPVEAAHTPEEAARELRWDGPDDPGEWIPVVRRFRDGHEETWWAADVSYGPYGPDKPVRVVVATTDPSTLPPLTIWYLATNLPRPGAPHADEAPFAPAGLAAVVRLYGLRKWVEQGYNQLKQELGWADFMVRSDQAIRRHWHLDFCAFSFGWRARSTTGLPTEMIAPPNTADAASPPDPDTTSAPERGKMAPARTGPPRLVSWPRTLRHVRGWLDPWTVLWRAWSSAPRLWGLWRSSTRSARAARSTSISVANKLPLSTWPRLV